MLKWLFLFSLPFKLCALWFLVTSLFFPFFREKREKRAPKTRFACLIPARNEESVVAVPVKSLLKQAYPPELFDVFVIPNNCTDKTESAALAAGARILACRGPVRYKGDALREAVGALLGADYDAFCVFDADNAVSPGFLAAMNDALLSGAQVAKAAMRAKNPYASWVSGCYALYYGLFDGFYNRSRAAVGLSAKLVGTGFAVSRDFLVKLGGWPTETMAEDAEFAAVCAGRGERVVWVPEAVTYDEAPVSFGVSLTQRRRWVSGIMDAAEREVPRLLRALPEKNAARVLDALFFLCAPFMQALSVVPALLTLSLSLSGGGARPLAAFAVWWASSAGAALLSALVSGLRGRRIAASVLLFPVFTASWLPLQILSAVRRATVWREIAHGANSAKQPEGAGSAPAP